MKLQMFNRRVVAIYNPFFLILTCNLCNAALLELV